MTHRSKISKAVIDVSPADHPAELAFWQAAVGGSWSSAGLPEYDGVELPGQEFELLVRRLGVGGSRVHHDIPTDDLAAEVERLERLGARHVRQLRNLWIMEDPAGLLFCVIHDPGLGAEGVEWP